LGVNCIIIDHFVSVFYLFCILTHNQSRHQQVKEILFQLGPRYNENYFTSAKQNNSVGLDQACRQNATMNNLAHACSESVNKQLLHSLLTPPL